jgi:hypothetical protein
MLNFVMGYFRDYWLVLLMCTIGHFAIPRLSDWMDRRYAAQARSDGAEQ